MTKYLIAATDKVTNATVYAKVSPTGRTVSFRNGVALSSDEPARIRTLNVIKAQATKLEGDSALSLLEVHAARIEKLAGDAWVRDLRIVLA